MALAKNPFFYKNIHQAIEAYGERHHITGRQHFAPLLGFTGVNGDIQLATALNYTTYNPSTPKPLTVDQLLVVMDESGEEVYPMLDALCRRYDSSCVKDSCTVKSDEDTVKDKLLKINSLAGHLAMKFAEFMEDGEIDLEEGDQLDAISLMIREEVVTFQNQQRVVTKNKE